MNIYEYTPQKSNKKALGTIIVLFSLATGLFLFAMIFPEIKFRWVLQLISIIAFVAIIFIISRYIAKSFLYAIVQNDDENLDFTVTEITNAGRTQITTCRIALANIEKSYLLDRSIPEHVETLKALQKSAKSEGRKSFNYCPDINPTEVCVILVEECGEKFLLKLSPDATLWEYLKKDKREI